MKKLFLTNIDSNELNISNISLESLNDTTKDMINESVLRKSPRLFNQKLKPKALKNKVDNLINKLDGINT